MSDYRRELTEYLSGYVTENKKKLIEENLARRTRYVSVLLEDIYKPHNASAVLRTCDCLGVQDIHVLEGEESYNANPYVVRGAAKWVDICKYDKSETVARVQALKEKGYRILGTTPHKDGIRPHEVPLDNPVIFAFGNEHAGLSSTLLDMADGYIQIPQVGFTESYNISVSASICLYTFMEQLWRSDIPFGLQEEEKDILRLRWYRECVKNADLHEKVFRNNRGETE